MAAAEAKAFVQQQQQQFEIEQQNPADPQSRPGSLT
jgi:hypothetical protein